MREQLLYEIHDPNGYLTPDVVLDISKARISQCGADRVSVSGARGRARPETLKATVCYDGGWHGEGEISYAGPNAEARGRLAIEILRTRIGRIAGVRSHFDLIGVSSVFNDDEGRHLAAASARPVDDVRVRAGVSGADQRAVQLAVREVEGLYTAGPAAGGGVRLSVTPRVASASAYLPRSAVRERIQFLET